MDYNKKEFLLPNSLRSSACYHARLEENYMRLFIKDCERSIVLHNDLDNQEEVQEAIDKLEVLSLGLFELREHIIKNYKTKENKYESKSIV